MANFSTNRFVPISKFDTSLSPPLSENVKKQLRKATGDRIERKKKISKGQEYRGESIVYWTKKTTQTLSNL